LSCDIIKMYGGKEDYNLLDCMKESENEARLNGKLIIYFAKYEDGWMTLIIPFGLLQTQTK